MAEWTHKKLVRRMVGWLKAQRMSTVVIAELAAGNNIETPDVIAWHGGASILIECKTSRADFHADKEKHFRKFEEHGMGDTRYFAAPAGVLKPEDIPEGWGLMEVDERFVRTKVQASHKEANKRAEGVMLVSAIRRLELSTAVYVVQDSDAENPGADRCAKQETKT